MFHQYWLLFIGFQFVTGHPLVEDCLEVTENAKILGVESNLKIFAFSLVDCHKFCRLQRYHTCSTYVYNTRTGQCAGYSPYEALYGDNMNDVDGYVRIDLKPDCFDGRVRKPKRRELTYPTGQTSPPVGGYGTSTWSQWGNWGVCDKLCGGGSSKRTRTCPIVNQCQGSAMENKTCNPQSCCTSWTKWSPCSVTCGKGTQKRTQRCMIEDHTVPSGYASKENAETQECTGKQDSCASWSQWQAWSACTTSCGAGQQTRTRTCSPSGATCPGSATESQACNANVPCATWTDWCHWTECSDTCGGGWQIRTRNCSVPDGCAGDPKEKQLCNVQACPYWGPWEDWGPCTKTCDNGERTRNRPCINDDTFCVGANATHPSCVCEGAGTLCHETEPCNTNPCVTATLPTATLTTWCQWSTCSDSCGGGWQIRTRNCSMEGQCSGDLKEKQLCNVQACPYFGPWDEWSGCDKNCGAGSQRTRTRACVNDDSFCEPAKVADPSCVCETGAEKASENKPCDVPC